jgi:hypothetical protein
MDNEGALTALLYGRRAAEGRRLRGGRQRR